MKYKNVLGKNFKRKEDAYKHFQSLRDKTPLGKILDEKTAITKNAMDELFKNYFLCNDEDWYQRKIGPGVLNWSFGYDSQGGYVYGCIKKTNLKLKNVNLMFLIGVKKFLWLQNGCLLVLAQAY